MLTRRNRNRNRKSNKSRRTRRNHKSYKTRRTQRKQHGGSACTGEYALVQGIKIPAATGADSSFAGLNIDNAMGKLYDPKCGSMPTAAPGPVYKL
jgi:hypothetical protein